MAFFLGRLPYGHFLGRCCRGTYKDRVSSGHACFLKVSHPFNASVCGKIASRYSRLCLYLLVSLSLFFFSLALSLSLFLSFSLLRARLSSFWCRFLHYLLFLLLHFSLVPCLFFIWCFLCCIFLFR